MQKLHALYRMLFSLAKEAKAEAVKYNAVAHQIFVKAVNLLQDAPQDQFNFDQYKWQMQVKPGFSMKMEGDCLIVDCTLIVLRDSGRMEVIHKPLPNLQFCLAGTKDSDQEVVKKIYHQVTQLVKDEQMPILNNQFSSWEDLSCLLPAPISYI